MIDITSSMSLEQKFHVILLVLYSVLVTLILNDFAGHSRPQTLHEWLSYWIIILKIGFSGNLLLKMIQEG